MRKVDEGEKKEIEKKIKKNGENSYPLMSLSVNLLNGGAGNHDTRAKMKRNKK